MNWTALESLNWQTPHQVLTGSMPDISMITRFKFWDPVYALRDDSQGKEFPSKLNEIKGWFVGFSESVGHGMTYKILADETNKILYHSHICLMTIQPNKHLEKEEPKKSSSSLRKAILCQLWILMTCLEEPIFPSLR